MATLTSLTDLITLHEGYRQFPYKDSVGKLTIGIGFNIEDVGLSREESQAVLDIRLRTTKKELQDALPWLMQLNYPRYCVMVDMAYNMGIEPFNHNGFKDWPIFCEQVRTGQYEAAARNMRSTLWARQVGKRAERLAKMMETGNWPTE